MRSFFFIFSFFALHKTIIPSCWYNQHRSHCRHSLPSLCQTFRGEKSCNWLAGTGVSLVEWRANDGGAAEAPRRVGYEHVGNAINAIKIQRGLSVTRQQLWNDQWKNLTEDQSSSVGKGEATSDRNCIVISLFRGQPVRQSAVWCLLVVQESWRVGS